MKLLNKNNYLIIENLLDEKDSNDIEKLLFHNYFPWYLTKGRDAEGNFYTCTLEEKLKYKKDKNVIDQGQFVHTFLENKNNIVLNNSEHTEILNKILFNFLKKNKFIESLHILRAKANLITNSKKYKKNSYGIPHIDFDIEHYVLLYYVNTSEGDTVLFDKNNNIFKKISPKKGKALFFKGNILHANGHPLNNAIRCVINLDLKINFNKNE